MFEPPSPPADVLLRTSICPLICALVTFPIDPSVTTWKKTGTVALKLASAWPCAEAGRLSAVCPRSGSRSVLPRPRNTARRCGRITTEALGVAPAAGPRLPIPPLPRHRAPRQASAPGLVLLVSCPLLSSCCRRARIGRSLRRRCADFYAHASREASFGDEFVRETHNEERPCEALYGVPPEQPSDDGAEELAGRAAAIIE